MKISVIIPIGNDLIPSTLNFLSSFYQKKSYKIEILLVGKISLKKNLKLSNNFKIIPFKENKGACFFRNEGIKKANGDFIMFIDSDAFLEKNFFFELEKIISQNKIDFVIAPKIINQKNKKIFSCGLKISSFYRIYDIGKNQSPKKFSSSFFVDAPNLCCAIFKKEILEKIKEKGEVFDNKIFFLFEELDLYMKMKKYNIKTKFFPQLICFHYGGGFPISKKLRKYLCFRNRLYVILKYHKKKSFLFFLKSFPYEITRSLYFALTNPYFFQIFKELPNMLKKMKKILIFNPGNYLYGAERGLINLIKALSKKFEIICVIPKKGPLEEELKKLNVKIIIFPLPVLIFSLSPIYYLKFLLFSLFSFLYFSFYVIKKNIDIIVTNSLLIYFSSLVAKITFKKHVWYIREFFFLSSLNYVLGEIVSALSDIIVVQSQAIKEKLFLSKKTYLIYEGIDEERFNFYDKFILRKEMGFPEDSIIVSIISRIHPEKGQLEFLKTYKRVIKEKKNLIILIVGEITPFTLKNKLYKKKIKKFIEKEGLKNVYLLGFRKDIDKILSLSDICVFPFLKEEPFGIAILEAIFYGKYVFFPFKGGAKEIKEIFKSRNIFELNELEKVIQKIKKPISEKKLFLPKEFSFSFYESKINDLFSKL